MCHSLRGRIANGGDGGSLEAISMTQCLLYEVGIWGRGTWGFFFYTCGYGVSSDGQLNMMGSGRHLPRS